MLTKQPTSFKNEQGQEVRYKRYLADGGIYTADKALGFVRSSATPSTS